MKKINRKQGTKYKNIQSGCGNWISLWKIWYVDNLKKGTEKKKNRRHKTTKTGKQQSSLRRRNWQVFMNIGSRHHKTNRNERKINEKRPQKNKKTSENRAPQMKSHLIITLMSRPSCKIFLTILKIKNVWTSDRWTIGQEKR